MRDRIVGQGLVEYCSQEEFSCRAARVGLLPQAVERVGIAALAVAKRLEIGHIR